MSGLALVSTRYSRWFLEFICRIRQLSTHAVKGNRNNAREEVEKFYLHPGSNKTLFVAWSTCIHNFSCIGTIIKEKENYEDKNWRRLSKWEVLFFCCKKYNNKLWNSLEISKIHSIKTTMLSWSLSFYFTKQSKKNHCFRKTNIPLIRRSILSKSIHGT